MLLADDVPAAYCQFGPLTAYPRAQRTRDLYPALPDAPLPAIITCIASTAAAHGAGLAKELVAAVCEDLEARGFAAVETYPEIGVRPDATSAATPAFWETVGFVVAAPDDRFPVMRRELAWEAADRAVDVTAFVVGLLVAAGCAPSSPSAASVISAPTATPAALESFPDDSPTVSPSAAAVAVDPALLDLLPADVAGQELRPDLETAAEIATTGELTQDVEAIAVGLYIQPGTSNADDLAIVNVVRLRPRRVRRRLVPIVADDI